jgi:hypothetical protein
VSLSRQVILSSPNGVVNPKGVETGLLNFQERSTISTKGQLWGQLLDVTVSIIIIINMLRVVFGSDHLNLISRM